MNGLVVRAAIDPDDGTDVLVERVIAAATEVHRHLGPGLLRQVYTAAMEHELLARDVDFTSDITLPLSYKGQDLSSATQVDFVIAERLVVRLQSEQVILPVHYAQLTTSLRLGAFREGLLINFYVARLINGVRRLRM